MEIYDLRNKKEYLEEVMTLEYEEWAQNKDMDRDKRIQKKINKFEKLGNEKSFCKLILLDSNYLVGFISIFPDDGVDGYSPWYATMYVKEEYRGKGYSKILNDAILKEANKRGFDRLYLKSTLNNYYEKFGAHYVKNVDKDEKLYYINTII